MSTTLITYYALALLSGYCAWRLALTARRRTDLAIRLWAAAFVAVALCALAGGTLKGYAARLDPGMAPALGRLVLCLAGAASLLFLSSIVHVCTTGWLRVILLTLAAAKFAVLVLWIADHDDARYVVYDMLATMLPVLVLCAWGGWSRQVPAARWILAGVLASLVAALMHQGRVALHPQFDHTDLFRMIQMVAMLCLYRAGLELRDRPGEAEPALGAPARGES